MQGILLLYLYRSIGEGGFAIDPGVATGPVGAYGGGVYLSTIIGGWLADRVLGSERVLFYSAVIIMLGHIALAVVPGIAGVAIGLILVALGSEDSRRAPPLWSGRCTPPTTPDATRASRCSTWASTSAHSSARS
jgi:dipeptide/tripeptide permease